jgi:hypothetical protein
MKTSEKAFLPNKGQMLDSTGRPITQSMFLELTYAEAAIYTLKDADYEYNGKLYPSLKRLYLLEDDPTEYEFATKYLLNWKHWQRLCENKLIRRSIDEWREELEIKLRSRAVKEMIKSSANGKIVASKWLADKGWAQRGAGRPTKAAVESEKAFLASVAEEFNEDVQRLRLIK